MSFLYPSQTIPKYCSTVERKFLLSSLNQLSNVFKLLLDVILGQEWHDRYVLGFGFFLNTAQSNEQFWF